MIAQAKLEHATAALYHIHNALKSSERLLAPICLC